MQYLPRLQNFWVYTIAIIALMYGINIALQGVPKKLSVYFFLASYLVLLYLVISSFVWNNNQEWRNKKVESTSHRIVKNVVDALLLVLILVAMYYKYAELRK